MTTSAPRPRRISDFKPTLTQVAQTSHYQVLFSVPRAVKQYLESRGLDSRFIGETVGLLCNDAVIPGSSTAISQDVAGYQGLPEKFAHTRIFTDLNLTFYVDAEYKTLKFLEHWMEFVTGGSEANSLRTGYHFRMRYPKDYKSDTTRILKFDRQYNNAVEYSFVGLFPKALSDLRVSYSNSEVLQANCTFSYDRYVAGKVSSKSWFFGFDRNFIGTNLLNKAVLSSNETTGAVESVTVRDDLRGTDGSWNPTGDNDGDGIPNSEDHFDPSLDGVRPTDRRP